MSVWRGVRLVLGAGLLTGAAVRVPDARAAPTVATLTVERADDASTCNDAKALGARINRAAGRKAIVDDAGDVALDIAIARTADGFAAHLVATGLRRGDRDFTDAGQRCDGLADAIAVSVALLLDDVATARRTEPSDDARRAVEQDGHGPVPSPRAPAAPTPRTGLDALAVESAGVLGKSTVGVEVGFGRRVTRVMTVGAGLFFLPSDIGRLGKAERQLALVALQVPACLATQTTDQAIGVELCGFPTLGVVAASTSDPQVPGARVAPWFAMAASATGTGPLVGPLRFLCRGDLMVPVTRTGLAGVPFPSFPVGVVGAFGIRALIP